ncbi:MAG TPA: aminotransferase class I/II-fold pyridoxal phosphate-dependent enzyme [Gemmatales bacterium]|nr:aminotransferase class I/II-fold pyridoxal phosphate-dependent enzyme [Gemmatales bacterium]HMP58627.1 aminotransferase class I/II-fold pyridoxal phosphate-dependent enzyme [Gemmatales bacterium]
MPRFDPIESFANMRHEFGEHGGVNMSIEASTTFTVLDAEVMPEIFQGRRGPERGSYLYGRHFNPTVYVLGRQVAALEGAEAGYCTASGMSAIAGTLMQLCDQGDHVVASDTLYGGTFALLKEFLPKKTGLSVTFVDIRDLAAVAAAFTPRTKVLYTETMSNPTLHVADLPALADLAHRHGAQLVVDNTFAPLMVAPLQHGADVVIHSLTKYMNGASDIIAGAICGRTRFIMQLMDLHQGALMLVGPTMDPTVAHKISLRLPHLGLRISEHSRRALIFAQRLADLQLPVIYPGLPHHPDHALLRRLHNPAYGFGGIFALDLGDTRRANTFMELLQNKDRFGFMAVSLGYFDTLMSCSASSTSSEMSPDELRQAGIAPGLVRISLGYTGTLEQRWEQLLDVLRILNLV